MALTRPKSLKDLALEHLRNSIIDGTLPMGKTLSERSISEELGVSKSPVREAFAQLRDEGLVIIEPQKGAHVFELSDSEVEQICDFREAIEMAAFELSLKRNRSNLARDMENVVEQMKESQDQGNTKKYLELDTEFHQLIFKHAENIYLSASYKRYVGKIAALRTHLSVLPKHTELSFKEHIDISSAIRREDLDRIRSLIHSHIDRTREAYSLTTSKI